MARTRGRLQTLHGGARHRPTLATRHVWLQAADGVVEVRWTDAHAGVHTVSARRTHGRMDATVTAIPRLLLTSSRPLCLDDLLNIAVPINDLLTVIVGSASVPESIDLWPVNRPALHDRNRRHVSVHGQGIGTADWKYNEHDILLRLGNLASHSGGLFSILESWRTLTGSQPDFTGRLLHVLREPAAPLPGKFLQLAGGLEAFHRKLHGAGSLCLPTLGSIRLRSVSQTPSRNARPEISRAVARVYRAHFHRIECVCAGHRVLGPLLESVRCESNRGFKSHPFRQKCL